MTDPVTGTTGYTYVIGGERATMTLPGGGTWTYRLSAEIEPKDAPNTFALAPQEIQGEQGRIADYGALQSYCEADYYQEGCPFGVASTPAASVVVQLSDNG